MVFGQESIEKLHYYGTSNDWCILNGFDIAANVCVYIKSRMNEYNQQSKRLVPFHSSRLPPITLNEYILRLIINTRCLISPVCVISAIVYIEKVTKKYGIELNEYNIFRLFSTALLLSYKTNEDPPHLKNSDYSRIAGLTLQEMNILERKLLQYLEYDLSLTSEEEFQARKITEIIISQRLSQTI
mmetsp:Transcript_12395/g.11230  ORF Transcript_12395/g.11230 Transcript_12395/m.11230 type:complete len:185 (+) Transcript_12395:97-651(+)